MNQTLEDIIKQADLNGLPKEIQLKIAVNYMESFLEDVIGELITVSCLDQPDEQRVKDARLAILTYFTMYDNSVAYFGNVNEFEYLRRLRRMILKFNTFNHMELTHDLIKLKSTYLVSVICKRKQLKFLMDKYINRNVNVVEAYCNELENELEQVPLIIDMVVRSLVRSFKSYCLNN